MISLILQGDSCVLPEASSTRHVNWEVYPRLPLVALTHLQALQKLLHRSVPLDEVALFHVQGLGGECADSPTSDEKKETWMPLDPGLSAEQLGLCDGNFLFLSCDPFNIFASRHVALPSAVLSSGMTFLPPEKGNDGILVDYGKTRMLAEERQVRPFWIPLLRGILQWRVCDSATDGLVLCGSSKRRVVKVGENGWVNGLATLPFSLGEWLRLQEVINTPSCGISARTLSWSVLLNSISENAAQRCSAVHRHYQMQKKTASKDDVETRYLWEVSERVRHGLLQGGPSNSGVDEATAGATFLSYVAQPSQAEYPILIAEDKNQNDNQNASSTATHPKDNGGDNCNVSAELEDGEEMRVPPCVLVGVAFQRDIEQYLAAYASSTSFASAAEVTTIFSRGNAVIGDTCSKEMVFPPLQGHFFEPYTGSFFVNGVLSHLAAENRVSVVPPSLGATLTITVQLDSRVFIISMDGEVVLAAPLQVAAAEEVLLLLPVVQLFSCGAVMDLH